MIPQYLEQLLARRPSFVGIGGFDPDAPLLAEITGHPTGVAVHAIEAIDTPQEREGPEPVVILARTYADLHRAMPLRHLLPSGRNLVIAVTEMSPQHRPTSIRLPSGFPWSSLRELRLVRGPGAFWRAEARLDRPAPLGVLLRAVLLPHLPKAVPHAPRLGAADRSALDWTVGTHAVRLDAAETEPSTDLVAHTDAVEPASPQDARARFIALPCHGADPRLAAEEVHVDPGSVPIPPVNENAVNPMGFAAASDRVHALMSYQGTGWAVHSDTAAPVVLPADGAVTDAEVAALRGHRSVSVDWDSHPGSVPALRAVAALAAAGVPLVSKVASPLWALPLKHELRARIDRCRPEDLDDPMARELHSIRTRRIALQHHSTRAHRSRLGLPQATPSVSVVLCTRRLQFLASILPQIDGQTHPDLELILVLHGIPADTPGVKEVLRDFKRDFRIVEVPGSTVFGEVLNHGVAAASGEYVTKFDDDDWYSPHHIADLLLASRYANADVVGNQSELIHLEQLRTTVRRKRATECYTKHLSGGTQLFRRDFFHALGGYRPVPTSEDRGLIEDTLDVGGTVYTTHGLGFVVSRRSSGHTWNVEAPYFLRGAVSQWNGRNLGPAVTADDLESCISSARKA